MMIPDRIYHSIRSNVKELTNLIPNIYCRDNSRIIRVAFVGDTPPDKKTLKKIKHSLKEFGFPILRKHYGYVEFSIFFAT